ncbi:hypothetical protein ACS0TY_022293 [Phlomoides rotata]
MANFVNHKNAPKSSIDSGPKSFVCRPLRSITSNKCETSKGAGVQVASFFIKTIALATVRQFSRSKCPFVWTGMQGLQVLCYPPLKWIQCWKPFGFMVRGMQMISGPLLVLSIADAVFDHSNCSNINLDDTENSPSTEDSQLDSENISASQSLQCDESTRIDNENHQVPLSMNWINQLCQELANQGITLPERINEEELQRFYVAANGDFSALLSSIKKTIRWRETYRILSAEELELWSNMIFWHGSDVNHRPCLIVRLGLACVGLPSHDRPRFAQAVVSQVEHGILHLVDGENRQITVLVDCQGLSPLRFPMQTLRFCSNILQDHFPNVLGCLIIIRLPSVVRVIAQTFIQVLKPSTKQKLRILGDSYKNVIPDYFQSIPSYLGGQCTCPRCGELGAGNAFRILDTPTAIAESVSDIVIAEDIPSGQPTYEYDDDMSIERHWSLALRNAVIGILIVFVLIAFIEGIYNPESRPVLPP